MIKINDILSGVILIAFLLVSYFDALRDSYIFRRADVSWWKFHKVKWIAFFLPMIFLTVFYFYFEMSKDKVITFLLTAIASSLVWRITYSKGTDMMIKQGEYFPTLKKVYSFNVHKCHSCGNFFKFETMWCALTLPLDGENYTQYYLCTGCAHDKKDAVKYFKNLTEKYS